MIFFKWTNLRFSKSELTCVSEHFCIKIVEDEKFHCFWQFLKFNLAMHMKMVLYNGSYNLMNRQNSMLDCKMMVYLCRSQWSSLLSSIHIYRFPLNVCNYNCGCDSKQKSFFGNRHIKSPVRLCRIRVSFECKMSFITGFDTLIKPENTQWKWNYKYTLLNIIPFPSNRIYLYIFHCGNLSKDQQHIYTYTISVRKFQWEHSRWLHNNSFEIKFYTT